MKIKFGSIGNDVKILQKYFKINQDGIFGKITENNVKKWQHLNGCEDNGILTDYQFNLIKDELFKLEFTTMSFGSNGNNVKELQHFLNIKSDGIFGNDTYKHVKIWQVINNEEVNGIVDYFTWEKMNKTVMLNISRLSGIIPDVVLDELPITIQKFNINSNLRLAHFLSQCAHESLTFSVKYENLNYSASGLLNTFPKYFNIKSANEFARQPILIANKVYANRMGNGNEDSGDGWRYRGRGYIQLTGKNNYKLFGDFINENIIDNPDKVANIYPLTSAGFYFEYNKLWTICDKGSSDDIVKQLTKSINGGYNGLDDRLIQFKKFNNILK